MCLSARAASPRMVLGRESEFKFGASLKGQKGATKEMTPPAHAFLAVAAAFDHRQLAAPRAGWQTTFMTFWICTNP